MEKIMVGLIKGRHPLPVEEYIFNEELEFPLNYQKLDKVVADFIADKVGVTTTYGIGLNREPDYGEIVHDLVRTGEKQLVVYITGLTPVTASLIKVCALNGVSLTLAHYDMGKKEYNYQVIFS